MTVASLGYLMPSESRVRIAESSFSSRGEILPDDLTAGDWDYTAEIGARQVLRVDLPGLLDECGLGVGSVIVAQLTWTSTATPLRGASNPVRVQNGRNVLDAAIPGTVLGGRVAVETRLALRTAVGIMDELAPSRPGSFLWRRSTTLTLEGGGARFPTLAASFRDSGQGLPPDAPWFFQFSADDLTRSATDTMQLWLNSDHPAVAALLKGAVDAPTRQLREIINYDVTRRLVAAAMESDDLDGGTDEDGTVGEMLRALCTYLYPETTMSHERALYRSSRGDHEAQLQGRLRLLNRLLNRGGK